MLWLRCSGRRERLNWRFRRSAPPARTEAPQRSEPAPTRQASAGNWSGGQVGGSNGGSVANNSFADPGSYICPPGYHFGSACGETPFGFNGHPAGYTIGPFLGYRFQFGTFVAGVETDVSYKNTATSESQSTLTVFGTPAAASRTDMFSGTMKQGWDGSVRGRLGVLVTPTTLLYGTGGVAFGKVSGSLAYTGTAYSCADPTTCPGGPAGTATGVVSFSENRVGFTVGGGVEVQVFGPWTARVEYRYTDLGKFSESFPIINSCATCGTGVLSPGASVDLHPSFQTVRLGLGMGF